jgi:dihydropteroate synthase
MKSFLGRVLDGEGMEGRVPGTAAAVAVAAFLGVDIVRVHDVATMLRVARVAHAIRTGPRA